MFAKRTNSKPFIAFSASVVTASLLGLTLLSACAPVEKPEKVVQKPMQKTNEQGKPVVYQVFTRLFGNKNTTNKPWGTIEENGVGKFNDFTSDALEGIRELGVTHIWYTGVPHHGVINDYTKYGISLDDPDVIKGRAGSPYAVKDYYSVNPDLAVDPAKRLEEFEALIARTHAHNMKVIIDIVPNHVARNYESLAKPEGVDDFGAKDDTSVVYHRDNNFYYVVDKPFEVPDVKPGYEALGGEPHPLSDGKFIEVPAKWTGNGARAAKPHANDWFETVKVNYGIRPDGSKDFPELPDGYDKKDANAHYQFWQTQVANNLIPDSWFKFRDIALYWTYKGVDGFRFDMSEMVPVEFWSFMNSAIKQVNPDAFLLAEIYNPAVYRDYIHLGKMDYLYDKVDFYDAIKPVMQGRSGTSELVRIQRKFSDIEHHLLHFLDNHDEQRISSPDFAGDMNKGKPALVVSALINSAPMMIYFGQEVGEDGSEDTGFGDPTRTTIFDYAGVPAHQRWMNDGKFDGGLLTSDERSLRRYYQNVLSFAASSPAMKGHYQGLHFYNLANTNGYNDMQMSFARWTESAEDKKASLNKPVLDDTLLNNKVLVVSNFSEDNVAYRFELSPKLRTKWALDNGQYVLKDELSNEQFVLEVTDSTASIAIKLNGLASAILTFDSQTPSNSKVAAKAEKESQYAKVDEPLVSQAVGQVKVINNIELPSLERTRTLRVYLPPSYTSDSSKFYPVIYMHDAQNLFDDATSFMGEWQVDESMDKIANQTGFEAIVVGIDNSAEHRINEYSAWDHAKYGVGQGRLYMQDIVDVVKPFIDQTYRTKSDGSNTAIMGSSMGGLISHFAIHEYPEVFGKAGIFSPSYWYSTKVYQEVIDKPIKSSHDLYFIVGEKEGDGMVSGMKKMVEQIKNGGHEPDSIFSKVVPNAEHNEGFWRSEFESAVLWLFNLKNKSDLAS